MNDNKPITQDFPLSYNAYAAFDATHLKTLMQQRLSENGTFTDQIFEGSNFNNLLDVVSYMYNVLLYYLNQTSNESLFSSSQIYENMNKIVKILNYKPQGLQTSILDFRATANEFLEPGVYTIPRFSYFTINDLYFCFNKDLTFIKSTDGVEFLSELSDYSLLYQGEFVEYPIYVSTGEFFEEFNIVSVNSNNENDPIDYNNIFVFVREDNGVWNEWNRVENLFLEEGSSKAYEVRINENQRYTIKLGNNVYGKKLNTGNLVALYYLKSNKEVGEVGPGTLDDNQLFFYNTDQYNTIMKDVRGSQLKLISSEEVNNITFTNTNASVPYSDIESSKQIKQNAPNFFKQQGRLVTVSDFEFFVKSNFNNFVSDVKVVNNWEYIEEHIRYLYNIGLKQPSLDSRVLYNQVNFADSCNFNNVYIYCIPKLLQSNEFNFNRCFLSLGLKNLVLDKVDKIKMSTVEPVFQDPVYYALGFGAASQEETLNKELYPEIAEETKLVIVKSSNSNISDSEIKKKIEATILNYFSISKTTLGGTIEIDRVVQDIYAIGGIESIYTERNNIRVPGLSLLGYNPVYCASNEDINLHTQTVVLPFFKVPFWYNKTSIFSQIEIIKPELLLAGNKEY
jgi:hypothetical protein